MSRCDASDHEGLRKAEEASGRLELHLHIFTADELSGLCAKHCAIRRTSQISGLDVGVTHGERVGRKQGLRAADANWRPPHHREGEVVQEALHWSSPR
eukprot:scaffold96696_cov36-Tisochrysis_lutea.AAC.3